MRLNKLNLLYLLGSVRLGLGAPAPDLTENNGINTNHTERDIVKRDSQILWGYYYGPQPSEIKGSKRNNDWFLCAAASISRINPYAIKKHFKAVDPYARKKRDEAKESVSVESIQIELFHIEHEAFEGAIVKHDEITEKNSMSGDAWWVGAYEIGAPRVGGNEYIEEEGFRKNGEEPKGGFKKNADADIGLRMITGLDSVTTKVDKKGDGYKKDLWDVLSKEAKSPKCIKKDKQWYGLTEVEGEFGKDNAKVTLYNTKKGEYTAVDFDDLQDDISHYSKLKNDDKL